MQSEKLSTKKWYIILYIYNGEYCHVYFKNTFHVHDDSLCVKICYMKYSHASNLCQHIFIHFFAYLQQSVCAYLNRGISFIYICSIDIFILKYISSRIPPTCLSIFSKLATLIIATKLFSFSYYVSYH